MPDSQDDWAEKAKRMLKAELKRADVTYDDLAKRLTDMGLPETQASVTMKINRGAFPTWFFMASMKAIGKDAVRLDDM
jgi:hypothetical protein